jgi:hypothetical protein
MLAFVELIRESYGSAEGYLKQKTSLTDEDIQTLRDNFVIAA